jgi:RNA polymerase sigma-70 factor (ECF subfamily)
MLCALSPENFLVRNFRHQTLRERKMDHDAAPAKIEEFLRLLAEHERSLTAYVHSLVTTAADADDILQECRVVLWRQFAESKFEPGTSFLAWARKIALHQILNYRRSQKRRPLSAVDQAFIESVAAEMDQRSGDLERRAEALRLCLRKLPQAHLQTIAWRYYEDCPIEEIAGKTQRTEGAVYRLLSRIRQVLNDCVTRTLTTSPLP